MRKITPYLIIGVIAYLLLKSNKSNTTPAEQLPDLPNTLRGIRNVSV